jgi:hypothetical protein
VSKHILVALSLAVIALLSFASTSAATAGSKLPDPIKAGVADELYQLGRGHSPANDEGQVSVVPLSPRPAPQRTSRQCAA